jgi:hypothetical protein
MSSLQDQIDSDISKCNRVIEEKSVEKADELCDLLVSAYHIHIKDIHYGLTSYTSSSSNIDVLKDITILKGKLKLFMGQVEDGLYKPAFSNGNINIHNNSNANNSNEINNNLKIDLDIQFKQLREDFKNNESITQEETEDIINKINEIEDISNTEISKKEKWVKLRGILNWMGTKGIDVGIKLLPIIQNILK